MGPFFALNPEHCIGLNPTLGGRQSAKPPPSMEAKQSELAMQTAHPERAPFRKLA